jgi:ATP-dependent protease Clp ATPase subunit
MLWSKQLRCSFCRKNDSQVEKLVAGPRAYTGARVYICDACVAIATQIMNEPPGDDNATGIQLSMWRRLSHRVRRLVRGGSTRRIGLPTAS